MPANTRFGLGLRLFFFFSLELVGLAVFAALIYELFGYWAAASLGTFCAAAVANAIVVRIYERGRLEDVGMGWSAASKRHLLYGTALGAGAALIVGLLPLLTRAASFTASAPGSGFMWSRLMFLAIMLLFGAVGEELLFRGYGFQVLMGVWGPRAAVLIFAVLFALMHYNNLDVAGLKPQSAIAALALVNTFAWGLLFGYAVHRSGDLWLPIGMHFGWNFALPLFGVRLSGFTMGVTGYELRWTVGSLWSGGAYGPEASLLTTAAVVAAGCMLYRIRFARQPLVLADPGREQAS